jgi:outer membrane protein TolC
MNLFIILFFLTNTAFSKTLTWQETLSLAQQNSLEYQAAVSKYKSVEQLEITGISGFLPKLSASANGTHSGAATSGDSTHSYSAQLTLSQNIFAGFADVNNYRLKKTATLQALADFNSTKAKLSADLKQAFAEVYYAQDFKKLAADILNRRRDNLRTVKLQYSVGHENKGSVMLSESYVAQAEYDVMTIAANEESLLEDFRRVLGISVEESIVIEKNIERDEPGTTPDFKALAQENYAVIAAQAAEQEALYNLRVTRSRFLPSLDFNGSYGYSGPTFFPEQDRWSMGLTLSIPLFDSLRDYASYRSNSTKLDSSVFSARNIAIKTATDLKRAYNDYVLALQKEKIDESFNKAAVLRADIARNKYKNGFLSFEDWDIIETDLILKQKTILDSERNRIIKQAQWEKALGVGVYQ